MVQYINKIFGLEEFRINRIETSKDEIYIYVRNRSVPYGNIAVQKSFFQA